MGRPGQRTPNNCAVDGRAGGFGQPGVGMGAGRRSGGPGGYGRSAGVSPGLVQTAAMFSGPSLAAVLDRAGKALAAMDGDGDGKVSREEFLAADKARFDSADTNGDGRLGFDEMCRFGGD